MSSQLPLGCGQSWRRLCTAMAGHTVKDTALPCHTAGSPSFTTALISLARPPFAHPSYSQAGALACLIPAGVWPSPHSPTPGVPDDFCLVLDDGSHPESSFSDLVSCNELVFLLTSVALSLCSYARLRFSPLQHQTAACEAVARNLTPRGKSWAWTLKAPGHT